MRLWVHLGMLPVPLQPLPQVALLSLMKIAMGPGTTPIPIQVHGLVRTEIRVLPALGGQA